MEDLSRLSTADLKALQSGNLGGVSTEGLLALRGQSPRTVSQPRQVSTVEDVAKSFGTGVVRSLPDLANMVAAGLNTGVEYATGGDRKFSDFLSAGQGLTESMVGQDYQPQTELGKYSKAAGYGVGSLPLGGGMGLAGQTASQVARNVAGQVGRAAASGVGAQAGSKVGGAVGQKVGGDTGELVGQIAGGLAGGVAGAYTPELARATGRGAQAAGSSAMDVVTPNIEKNTANLVQKAKDFDIPLTVTQVAPSRTRNTIQKASQNLPFSGVSQFDDIQLKSWNKALAKTIGVEAESLGPETINTFLGNTKKAYDGILNGVKVSVGSDDLNAVRNIVQSAGESLSGDLVSVVEKNAKRLFGDIAEGINNGEKIASLRSTLIKNAARSQGGAKKFINDMVDVLDDVASRSLPKDKVAALQNVRRQYRNYKTLEPLAEKASGELINPTQLMQRVASSPYIKASRIETGADDLVDLARIGKEFLGKLGGSDTYDKLAIGGGVAGAIIEPTTTATVGAGLAGNRAYQNLYNQSQYLVNRAASKAMRGSGPTMLQRVSDAIGSGSIENIIKAAGSAKQAIKTLAAIGKNGDESAKAQADDLANKIRQFSIQNNDPNTPRTPVLAERIKNTGGFTQGVTLPLATGAAGLGAANLISDIATQPNESRERFANGQSVSAPMQEDLSQVSTEVLQQQLQQLRSTNTQEIQPMPMTQDVSKTFVVAEEGIRNKVYRDSVGIKTVGIGFNMEQGNAKAIWARAKIPESFDRVFNGQQELSNESAQKLFDFTHKASSRAARKIVPFYKDLSKNQQAALNSMVFQLGSEGTRKFRNTLSNLKKGNGIGVENGIINSLWARQTPARAKRTALMLAYDLTPQEAERRLIEQNRISARELKFH
jgi:GH24 family phage-related lysozyme (muramidase)